MQQIGWDDFTKVELRVGRVLSAEPFPQARKPAYILQVDFGPEVGVRKSSAQVTVHYRPEELVGRLVVGVVNFPAKQIGPLMSECLVTGFHDADGHVALCVPDRDVPLGTKLL
ncbi:tRNA-binding protein [Luteimonas mephitis]|nr:tRNA-binding protein [Luteimonas mephitis]